MSKCACSENNVVNDEVKKIVDEYKNVKGSLITVLQKVQDVYGYLPIDIIEYVSEQTGIKPAKVMGVATFYTQFRLKPVGKNLIMLCQGTACHVNGSEKIYDAVCEYLQIKEGETTQDNMFTLNNVACLGCCSLSPVMMINNETYGSLTPSSAVKILQDIQKGGSL